MNTQARRFYRHVRVTAADGVYGVALDERTLRTPRNQPFRAPTRALAEAVASEWEAQGEHIVPARMPITQLAFAAIDATPERRAELSRGLAKYVETDLVCHRAASPPALAARQAQAWDPIVAWAGHRFHMRLPVVTGVVPAEIPPQHLSVLERAIDDLDDFRATALAHAITLAGSALIGFALLEGRLDARAAYAAASLDEEWSLEKWGEDAEARARLERRRAEFDALGRFIAAVESP